MLLSYIWFLCLLYSHRLLAFWLARYVFAHMQYDRLVCLYKTNMAANPVKVAVSIFYIQLVLWPKVFPCFNKIWMMRLIWDILITNIYYRVIYVPLSHIINSVTYFDIFSRTCNFFFCMYMKVRLFYTQKKGLACLITYGHKLCQNLQSVNFGEYARNYHKENANVMWNDTVFVPYTF